MKFPPFIKKNKKTHILLHYSYIEYWNKLAILMTSQSSITHILEVRINYILLATRISEVFHASDSSLSHIIITRKTLSTMALDCGTMRFSNQQLTVGGMNDAVI